MLSFLYSTLTLPSPSSPFPIRHTQVTFSSNVLASHLFKSHLSHFFCLSFFSSRDNLKISFLSFIIFSALGPHPQALLWLSSSSFLPFYQFILLLLFFTSPLTAHQSVYDYVFVHLSMTHFLFCFFLYWKHINIVYTKSAWNLPLHLLLFFLAFVLFSGEHLYIYIFFIYTFNQTTLK